MKSAMTHCSSVVWPQPPKVAATLMIDRRRETKLKPRLVMAGSILVSMVMTISFACAAEQPATPQSQARHGLVPRSTIRVGHDTIAEQTRQVG
jgi:hypothetical protein